MGVAMDLTEMTDLELFQLSAEIREEFKRRDARDREAYAQDCARWSQQAQARIAAPNFTARNTSRL